MQSLLDKLLAALALLWNRRFLACYVAVGLFNRPTPQTIMEAAHAPVGGRRERAASDD